LGFFWGLGFSESLRSHHLAFKTASPVSSNEEVNPYKNPAALADLMTLIADSQKKKKT
jgi:hypothetical protein